MLYESYNVIPDGGGFKEKQRLKDPKGEVVLLFVGLLRAVIILMISLHTLYNIRLYSGYDHI